MFSVSKIAFKKTKSSEESAMCDHLLNCKNIPSFEEFTILANGNNNSFLKSKKACLINEIDLFQLAPSLFKLPRLAAIGR